MGLQFIKIQGNQKAVADIAVTTGQRDMQVYSFHAAAHEEYHLIDRSTGRSPTDLRFEQQGNDLIVRSEQYQLEIIIEDYAKVAQKHSFIVDREPLTVAPAFAATWEHQESAPALDTGKEILPLDDEKRELPPEGIRAEEVTLNHINHDVDSSLVASTLLGLGLGAAALIGLKSTQHGKKDNNAPVDESTSSGGYDYEHSYQENNAPGYSRISQLIEESSHSTTSWKTSSRHVDANSHNVLQDHFHAKRSGDSMAVDRELADANDEIQEAAQPLSSLKEQSMEYSNVPTAFSESYANVAHLLDYTLAQNIF